MHKNVLPWFAGNGSHLWDLISSKEFMNSWLVFIKRCFSLPRIYSKKKKKREVVKPGASDCIYLKTQKQKKVGLFSMDNTFHFRIMAWIHYVDSTVVWHHSMLTRTVTQTSRTFVIFRLKIIHAILKQPQKLWDPRSVILSTTSWPFFHDPL